LILQSYSGCQHGYYQEKGYRIASLQGQKTNQEKICCWLGRKTKIITIFCQDNTKNTSRRPTKKSKSKGKNTMAYKLGRITRGRGVYKTNCTTKFVSYFNNKIMSMEHIFQDISKQMVETTYTLRLD